MSDERIVDVTPGAVKRRDALDKSLAGALRLAALILLIVDGLWLAQWVRQYDAPAPIGKHSVNLRRRDRGFDVVPVWASTQAKTKPSHDSTPQLLLLLNRISIQDRLASVTVDLVVPGTAMAGITDSRTNQGIASCDPVPTLCPQDADQTVTIVGVGGVLTGDPVQAQLTPAATAWSIPLRAFVRAAPSGGGPVSFTASGTQENIDLLGEPQQYPADWYELDSTFALVLPPPLTLQIGRGTSSMPLAVFVGAGIGTRDFNLTLAQSDPKSSKSHVRLIASRERPTEWYILTLALTPFLLSLIFGHFVLSRASREALSSLEALGAFAVFLLAILPLRSVLVPADLLELTYVDVLLGGGVVVMVVVLLLAYAHGLWPVSPQDWGESLRELTLKGKSRIRSGRVLVRAFKR